MIFLLKNKKGNKSKEQKTLRSSRKFFQAGFTLLELLVSISIMVFMLTIILLNYHRFNSTFNITNLAYDVALSVRQAQTYGVSIHSNVGAPEQSDQFGYGYGIHFDPTNDTQYILFADNLTIGQGTQNKFDGCAEGDSDTCVETYTLESGYYVSKVCVTSGSDTRCWSEDGQNTDIKSMDIVFDRPNPDANIYGYLAGGAKFPDSTTPADSATLTISSSDNAVTAKVITVSSTGQISVSQ